MVGQMITLGGCDDDRDGGWLAFPDFGAGVAKFLTKFGTTMLEYGRGRHSAQSVRMSRKRTTDVPAAPDKFDTLHRRARLAAIAFTLSAVLPFAILKLSEMWPEDAGAAVAAAESLQEAEMLR
jgi:hypothetical protein